MAKSENGYLYIVTGDDSDATPAHNRYIIKYNTDTSSYVKTIAYQSGYAFIWGEPFLIGDESNYLLTHIFFGSSSGNYEIINLEDTTIKDYYSDLQIYCNRRVFLRSGIDYYFINIKNTDIFIFFRNFKNCFIIFLVINTFNTFGV